MDRGYDDDVIDWNATEAAAEAVGLQPDADEVFEEFRVRTRNYRRFALFSKEVGDARVPLEVNAPLPCMLDEAPRDPVTRRWRAASSSSHADRNAAHPSYLYERVSGEPGSDCHCNLGELLATDWEVVCDALGRTRRDIMGTEVIDELNRLGAKIADAGLSTYDHRLLAWFD